MVLGVLVIAGLVQLGVRQHRRASLPLCCAFTRPQLRPAPDSTTTSKPLLCDPVAIFCACVSKFTSSHLILGFNCTAGPLNLRNEPTARLARDYRPDQRTDYAPANWCC